MKTVVASVFHVSGMAAGLLMKLMQIRSLLKKKPFYLTMLQVSGCRRSNHFRMAISSLT